MLVMGYFVIEGKNWDGGEEVEFGKWYCIVGGAGVGFVEDRV